MTAVLCSAFVTGCQVEGSYKQVSFGLVFSFPLSLYIGCHCACVTDLGYAIIKW